MNDLARIYAAEHAEKQRIRDYFGQRRGGVFVEVGANEPVSPFSQSWHLEHELGWRGLLVEPIPALAEQARQQRPNAIVCECACTAPEKTGVVNLLIPQQNGELITGHAALQANVDDHAYTQHQAITVRAVTLTELLDRHGIDTIDLLSIDVEGLELDVLRGLDFTRFIPRLILLEDKHVYLTKHLFLKRLGYTLARRENGNCWYIAPGEPIPDEPWRARWRLYKRLYLSIWWKKLKLAWRQRTLAPFRTL